MNSQVDKFFEDISKTFDAVRLPVVVLRTIERHKQHMMMLASALYEQGKDEAFINIVLEKAFRSFATELSNTVAALQKSGQLH